MVGKIAYSQYLSQNLTLINQYSEDNEVYNKNKKLEEGFEKDRIYSFDVLEYVLGKR